ncbi:hypothetical protein TcBrA4_0115070 [Trypanosoma cruzi]|nr:hypothetical protein TcBrA4_0115070 [Trypanosoma cruzi]
MERTRGLNCSSGLSGTCKEDFDPRNAWQRTVEANQKMLDIVRGRETRSSAAAELFRSRYFALLHELAAEEEEVKALNAHSRDLVAALRDAQLHGCGQGQRIDKIHKISAMTPNAGEDTNAIYKQLLQRLTHTSRLRDELRDEVQRLQSTCKEALHERAALMQSVDAQREALEPLLKEADDVARAVEMVRATLRTYGSHKDDKEREKAASLSLADLLHGVDAWSFEEKRAIRRVTALLSSCIGVEDDCIKTADCGRLRSVEEAVRFYQTWNDALMRSLGDFSREMNGRREGLYARIDELKRFRTTQQMNGAEGN